MYIMSQAHSQHPMEPTVRGILPEEMLLGHAIGYLISGLELIQDSDQKEVCLYQVSHPPISSHMGMDQFQTYSTQFTWLPNLECQLPIEDISGVECSLGNDYLILAAYQKA